MNEQMQLDLDAAIDKVHAQAERAETEAQAIIQRIRRAGADAITRSKRDYGNFPNPWRHGEVNLSAQQQILRNDPSLAFFLSDRAGVKLVAADERKQEAERRKAESIARLQAETEQMRDRNAAHRQQQAHEQTHGRYSPIHGRVI